MNIEPSTEASSPTSSSYISSTRYLRPAEQRLNTLVHQKICLEEHIHLLQREGDRCVPIIREKLQMLHEDEGTTSQDLQVIIQKMIREIQIETEQIQADETKLSEVEKHFSDGMIISERKKEKTETKEIPTEINTLSLEKKLEWFISEDHRLQELAGTLQNARLSTQDLGLLSEQLGLFITPSQAVLRIIAENRLHNAREVLIKEAIDRGDTATLLRIGQLVTFDNFYLSNHGGFSPLAYAVAHQQSNVVSFLIDTLHVNPNTFDHSDHLHHKGKAPLLYAVSNNDEPMIQLLIQKGAFVDFPSSDQTALNVAIDAGNDPLAQRLINLYHANPNARALAGHSPLVSAIINNNLNMIRFLKEHGANLDRFEFDGSTPLTYALLHGQMDIAKLLFELGANIHLPDGKGRIPKLLAQGNTV